MPNRALPGGVKWRKDDDPTQMRLVWNGTLKIKSIIEQADDTKLVTEYSDCGLPRCKEMVYGMLLFLHL